MTVKALMPVRIVNLVAPLSHKDTAMHVTDTAAHALARSGAVSSLIGPGLRLGDVDCASGTPGIATSTTATRTTTTTRAPKARLLLAADTHLFQDLVQAYLDCRCTKRNSASALAFEARVEHNLYELFEEISSGCYQPGRSICFVITRPKPREVWAAEFRDRVVHHLLYNLFRPAASGQPFTHRSHSDCQSALAAWPLRQRRSDQDFQKEKTMTQMQPKTLGILERICTAPMARTGLGTHYDAWTAKIIDNLAAAGYIKREPDGSYGATNKGRALVENKKDRATILTRITKSSCPSRITAATAKGIYLGHETTKSADRPGADDFLKIPSRHGNRLHFRGGRVEAVKP